MFLYRIISAGNRQHTLLWSLLPVPLDFTGLSALFNRVISCFASLIDNFLGKKKIIWGLFLLVALNPGLTEARVHGGLVLMFDDGYANWLTAVAPELARVGGVATAYVTLNNIRSEKLTYEDLRNLQNHYGWEIGTHTNHHFNPQEFVKRKGLSAWTSQELVSAIRELRTQGLKIDNLSFPFDATTPEVQAAVVQHLESFRRPEPLALGSAVREDGSIPGTEISLANYVPLGLIKKWIDLAHNQDRLLFLYGHQVLPDADFVTGTVEATSPHTLTATEDIKAPPGADLYLVPDTSKRSLGGPIRVVGVAGKQIQVGRGDLRHLTKPGATFMIGPGYGLRWSDFRALVDYAAPRVKFYTVHQVVRGQWYKN